MGRSALLPPTLAPSRIVALPPPSVWATKSKNESRRVKPSGAPAELLTSTRRDGVTSSVPLWSFRNGLSAKMRRRKRGMARGSQCIQRPIPGIVYAKASNRQRVSHAYRLMLMFWWRKTGWATVRWGDVTHRAITTVFVHVPSVPCRPGSCPANTKDTSISFFSTWDNSTTMAPIDDAIADFDLRKPGDDLTLRIIAERHGVNCLMLEQRCKRLTGSWQDGYAQQQKLSPQQEKELEDYIAAFTACGLSSTRAIIQNLALNIAKQHVGQGWVTRFIY
jgi:hypothetical protein